MAKIVDTVCYPKGHNLQSMAVKQIVDPHAKVAITVFEIRCTQCGKTLSECDAYKKQRGESLARKEQRAKKQPSPSDKFVQEP